MMTAFHVYILRCSDGSYYVGCAEELRERVRAHNEGRGPAYTYRRRPVRLVHVETYEDQASALKRERQIKKWTRAKKEALIAGCPERLRLLSRSRR